MPNFLQPEKVLKIREMSAAGATKREIERATGVAKQTIVRYSGRGISVNRDLKGALDRVVAALADRGIDANEIEAVGILRTMIVGTCPTHPSLTVHQSEQLQRTGRCPRCASAGSVRHHARRKAEGRPIVPPLYSKRQEPANDAAAPPPPPSVPVVPVPEPEQIPALDFASRPIPRATVAWKNPLKGLVGAAIAPPSAAEQLALCADAKKGDLWARDVLIAGNLKFVHKIAMRYARVCRHLTVDDLANAGASGMLRAIEKFDPSVGVTFLTYAGRWIHHHIVRTMEDEEDEIRIPVHVRQLAGRATFRDAAAALMATGISHEDMVRELAKSSGKKESEVELALCALPLRTLSSMDAPFGDSEGEQTLHDLVHHDAADLDLQLSDGVRDVAIRKAVAKFRRTLDDGDRAIFDGRLFVVSGDKLTLEELGKKLGVTREAVRQHEVKILARLRSQMKRFQERTPE